MTTAQIPESTQTSPISPSTSSSNGRSIFEDPAIGEAAKNDAFVRFVSLHWRSVLLALVAIGAAMIGYNIFTTTALEKRARATSTLADIQQNYEELVTKQGSLVTLKETQVDAKDEAAQKAASESLARVSQEVEAARGKLSLMLDSLDSQPPFNGYAALYRGLLAGRFGDYKAVEAALSAAPAWEVIDDVRSSRRFIAETIHLALVRTLAQSDEYIVSAKDKLLVLAKDGEYKAVEALNALSVLSLTSEEQQEAMKVAETLRGKFPSQIKKIDQITERLR